MKKSSVGKYLQNKRATYQTGGVIKKWMKGNPNAVAAAGSLGSSIVDMADPQDEYGVQSDAGAIGGGALQGLSAGAAFGPVGAGIGAVVGGVAGALGNSAAKSAAEQAKLRKTQLDTVKANQESQNILASYDNMGTGMKSLKSGGTLYSWPGGWQVDPLKFKPTKLTFTTPGKFQTGGEIKAGGGSLKPIGESDSFEVEGNEPTATDDVQVGDAFVDHDEVVKPGPEGLRIFSDTLKPVGSKYAFSKLAKQLEKQKTKDEKRFPEQNAKIENKLDNLFNIQQAMNGNNNGESPEEGMHPVGESDGAGFEEGNMFEKGGIRGIVPAHNRYNSNITPEAMGMHPGNYIGGRLMQRNPQQIISEQVYNKEPSHFEGGGRLAPIESGDHQFKGIGWTPKMKGYRTYHEMTPIAEGLHRPVGFASKVMAGAQRTQSGEDIYRANNPHPIAGRYKLGGQIFTQGSSPVKRKKTGTTFDVNSMSPEKFSGAGYKDGGTIHIKPENVGKFTAYKQRTGKTTEEALHSSNPHVRQMANFARNAKKWHHQTGGIATPDQYTPYDLYAGQQGAIQHALKSGAVKGGSSFENIPEVLNQLPGLKNKGTIRGYDYIDMPTDGSIANLPKQLVEAGATEDTFPEFPGRRVTKLYYGQDAPVTAPAMKPAIAGRNMKQPVWNQMMVNGKSAGRFQVGGTAPLQGSNRPTDIPAEDERYKFNLNDGLSTAATLAPIFGNMQVARRLPPVPEVYLNKSVNLGRVNAADQISLAQQGLRTASLAAQQNSVNPNAQQAGMGNAQAQFVNQTNSIYGDVNRQNTQIRNQEALYNSQIQGINNQLLGQRSQSEQARASNMLGLQSKNRAALSQGVGNLTQQSNMKALDKQKYAMFMAWLNKQGQGLGERNQFLESNKMGGVIRTNRKLSRKVC